MRRTKALLSCLLALALVMLTACGAKQQTVHRLSADRVTQAATVSQLQEVSDLIVVFTPETQENVLSRYSDGNVSSGYTRTTGRVSQVLKGQAPEQLVITEECYTLDDALWTQGAICLWKPASPICCSSPPMTTAPTMSACTIPRSWSGASIPWGRP